MSVVETEALLKKKSLFEFSTYATGRQNIAFADVSLTLTKKFNPLLHAVESVMGYLLDSVESPRDVAEIVLYPFDGRESLSVPDMPGANELRDKDAKINNSNSNNSCRYDNFVFAIVNKIGMQRLRESRFDISLTFTKDHAKLPAWATVMSESAEITEMLLTPQLAKVIADAGNLLDYLIITDQPVHKPTR